MGQDSKVPRVRGDKIPSGTLFQVRLYSKVTRFQGDIIPSETFLLKRVQGVQGANRVEIYKYNEFRGDNFGRMLRGGRRNNFGRIFLVRFG